MPWRILKLRALIDSPPEVIGGQEVRLAAADDLADQLLIVLLALCSHQGLDREHPQRVSTDKVPSAEFLRPLNGKLPGRC